MRVLDAFDLTGEVAVVTGGNTGPGEVFAKTPSKVRVAVGARTRECSEKVVHALVK